ncbi:glycosyl hydrolase [Paraburkholderia sp. SOS3]|nr:glycosyl hydrolase [Paraburkholderia sp. SOS3]
MTVPSWETISTNFLKGDKPYGGGAFQLRSSETMTLKIVGPEAPFKPASEWKNPDVAEHAEPWMDNSAERLNRSTVSLLRGTLERGMTRHFREPAQNAAWWYSKDWNTIYIATDWMDYRIPVPDSGLSPHVARLWRSVDGGKTWAQLDWPDDHNVNRLHFLDSQRGYAIGWGPRVWRTMDGGRSWHEIALPPMATDPREPRRAFSSSDLGPDGVLRVAYYVPMLGRIRQSSVVYRLRWDATRFEQDVVLPDQVVVQLASSNEPPGYTYSVHALSTLGPPRNRDDRNDNARRTGALSTWSSHAQSKVEQLHTFDQRYSLDGMGVGKHGVMLVYATDATRDGAPHDLTFYSRDHGKSWDDIDDGIVQGSSFDPQTNTQYGLYAYTLKKRSF